MLWARLLHGATPRPLPSLSVSMRPTGTRPVPATPHEQKTGGQHNPDVSWALGHPPCSTLKPRA